MDEERKYQDVSELFEEPPSADEGIGGGSAGSTIFSEEPTAQRTVAESEETEIEPRLVKKLEGTEGP